MLAQRSQSSYAARNVEIQKAKVGLAVPSPAGAPPPRHTLLLPASPDVCPHDLADELGANLDVRHG